MKNEKGFAHILILILLVLVLGVVWGLFFMKSSTKHTVTILPVMTKATSQVTFPTSTTDVPEVKSGSDVDKINSTLDAADLNQIDTMLDDTSKDLESF